MALRGRGKEVKIQRRLPGVSFQAFSIVLDDGRSVVAPNFHLGLHDSGTNSPEKRLQGNTLRLASQVSFCGEGSYITTVLVEEHLETGIGLNNRRRRDEQRMAVLPPTWNIYQSGPPKQIFRPFNSTTLTA